LLLFNTKNSKKNRDLSLDLYFEYNELRGYLHLGGWAVVQKEK
jgi:hypothetical protein